MNSHSLTSLFVLEKRLYPSSSFWRTFRGRKGEVAEDTSNLNSPGVYLHLLHSQLFSHLIFECGEIDGVVLGSWTNVNESSSEPVIDENDTHAGYWAAAAVWSNAWDQRTIDRVSYCSFFVSEHFKRCVELCGNWS